MSEAERKSDRVSVEYDRAAVAMPELSLLNFGYATTSAAPAEEDRDPEHFCLELYRHVGDEALAGQRVLEVSCGRGGGAAFLVATFRPALLVGIDLNEKNLEIARRRFGDVEELVLRCGRAERLEFADGSFDAAVNVEASHLYEDPAGFFAEVFRVLRPGGRFLYADLFWQDSDPESLLRGVGFEVRSVEDITPNVLHALELDSARRERVMKASLPEAGWQECLDWSGIQGHRSYNRFASGEWVYLFLRLQRP